MAISIHALREEGDDRTKARQTQQHKFLSTPSARRATSISLRGLLLMGISIHALREEGDQDGADQKGRSPNFYPRPPRGGRLSVKVKRALHQRFLSTPSARRATFGHHVQELVFGISIHALREEGDRQPDQGRGQGRISIHALREEGDKQPEPTPPVPPYFYPRPPRGGRRS